MRTTFMAFVMVLASSMCMISAAGDARPVELNSHGAVIAVVSGQDDGKPLAEQLADVVASLRMQGIEPLAAFTMGKEIRLTYRKGTRVVIQRIWSKAGICYCITGAYIRAEDRDLVFDELNKADAGEKPEVKK